MQQVLNIIGSTAKLTTEDGFQVVSGYTRIGGSDGKESVCNVGDPDSILQLRRSLEGGHGNSLQYFCLVNPMDRGA